MSADYRVDITIGPTQGGTSYAWSINKGDPPVLPVVLDGLSVSWQFPDSDLWPVQPEPLTAQFSILAASTSDLAGIDLGTPVLIRIWAGVEIGGVEYDSVTFAGRLGEPVGHPITFGHPTTGDDVDGWQLDLQSVDLYADLGELTPVGEEDDVVQSSTAWVDWLFGLVGKPVPLKPGVVAAPTDDTTYLFPAEDNPPGPDETGAIIEGNSLASVAEDLLAQSFLGGMRTTDFPQDSPFRYTDYATHGFRRPILRPNLDQAGAVDPVNPFRYEWASRRYGATAPTGPAAPARFALLTSGYFGPELVPPFPASTVDMSVVIDADYIDIDATWRRSKFDDPNDVTVSNSIPNNSTRWTASGYPVWRSRTAKSILPGESTVHADISDTRITTGNDARFLASMYLDDSENADVVWSAEGFVWYASEDPAWPVNRSLFPGTYLHCQDYSAPIVIDGIPASQNPGRPWHVGVLKAATWQFERGGFSIAFDLYPRTPRPWAIANNALTWNDIGTGIDWTELDPAFNWLDYRLVRSAALD